MLLQQIVGTLDAELDRLGKIREIIVKLGRSRNLIERFKAEMLLAAAPPSEPPPPPPPRTLRAKPTVKMEPKKAAAPVRSHRAVESSAFAKANPAGPIVVSAQELTARKQRKTPAPVVQSSKARVEIQAESSDKLARDLSQRWLSSR